MPVVRVVVLDHSDVRRLGEFMDRYPQYSNLGFDSQNVHVSCVGLGGLDERS